jgi:uroporphyrinogen decarboxylase
MTHRERFNRIFSFQPVDRIPCYFFGSWNETKLRWQKEGFDGELVFGNEGPQLPGMDPDWEPGMWNIHNLVVTGPLGDIQPKILEENEDRRVVRTSLGEEVVERKDGVSIPHTRVYALEPTASSWKHFKKFLNPYDSKRFPSGWKERAAELNKRDVVTTFMGGSLYGWLRGWMGVENISYIMYDDPELLKEMVEYLADFFMQLMEPVLKVTKFDFVYFFEDCCGSSGPLFSPDIYGTVYDDHYRRMIRFYKDAGVPFALIDSDGWSEKFMPSWLGSGFDIMFPVEVGKWNANPGDLRGKFGRRLCIFGAINKNLIFASEYELKEHLLNLKPCVEEGGFIPIPDHRIPPQVSYRQMLDYIRIFGEVFEAVPKLQFLEQLP